MFALDDQFDSGVADLIFGVVAVAYGNQVVAVAFDKAFGAVLPGLRLFTTSISCPVSGSVLQAVCPHLYGGSSRVVC